MRLRPLFWCTYVNRINAMGAVRRREGWVLGLLYGAYAGRSEAEAVCMLWRQGPGGGENREHNIMIMMAASCNDQRLGAWRVLVRGAEEEEYPPRKIPTYQT